MKSLAALIVCGIPFVPQCDPPRVDVGPPPTTAISWATSPPLPRCEGDVVYVTDDEAPGCDLVPPQQLHMLITGPDYQQVCDRHGGRILFVDHVSAHCADIDY